MQHVIGIYGASGAGRGVAPLAKIQFTNSEGYEVIFIDDNPTSEVINGYKCFKWQEFLSLQTEKTVCIAIADSKVREKLVQRCQSANICFNKIIADNAIIMEDVAIGEGSIISPFVCITSNIKIGSHFQANIASIIEHDCIIGDYVTFAPSVRCNGNVHIDDHAYIGTGAIIKQGTADKPLKIGKGAIVGMGAVVTKDVPAGTTVIGNPAKPMIR